MGLDSVELLLSVEDTFQIKIPDRDAEKFLTVGELHEWVVSELIRLERSNVNRDIVFDILRSLICFQLGIKPEKVVPGANFIEDLSLS